MGASKITLGEIEPVALAVNAALPQAQNYGARLKLRELLRQLAAPAQDLETECQALIAQYAETGEDGKPLTNGEGAVLFGEQQATVEQRWQELRSTKVTVRHRLTLEDVAGLPADPALDALELLLV